MKLGLALPAFDLETGVARSIDQLSRDAQAAESAGFDSVWVMDHFWLDNVPKRAGGHDPLVALSYLAARTDSVELGTLVACNVFRPVGQLAREASALAEASGGRFVLGLGAGWEKSEFEAFGFAHDQRLSRLEETLNVLPRLLAGEDVSYAGEFVRLKDAQIPVASRTPRVFLGGVSDRLLSLAARYSDGWNTTWHGSDTGRFEAEGARLRDALDAVGRPHSGFEVSVGLSVLPLEGAQLSSALARAERLRPANANFTWLGPPGDLPVTGNVASIAECVQRFAGLGADHVILNVSVSPFSLFDSKLFDNVAPLPSSLR